MADRPFCLAAGVSFFPFYRLISEVFWSIVTGLCHMFDGDPDL